MDNQQTPIITSFVIRFVHQESSYLQRQPIYRGTIHNVQTNQEIPFTRWRDAVEFIQRFVPIDSEDQEAIGS